jgi:hypothetical protein
MGPRALICLGAYNAVKTALSVYIWILLFVFFQKINVSQLMYASLSIAVNDNYTYMYIRQGRLNSIIGPQANQCPGTHNQTDKCIAELFSVFTEYYNCTFGIFRLSSAILNLHTDFKYVKK